MRIKLPGLFFTVIIILGLLLIGCSSSTTTTSTTTAPTTTAATTTTAPTTTAATTTTAPTTTSATTTAAPTTTTSTPTSTSGPKSGGNLVRINTATSGAVFGLPWLLAGFTGQVYIPSVDYLINMDAEGRIVPSLAESWQVAPDKLSVTFKLRQGVKFTDGTDFNAQAAKWMIDLILANKGNITGVFTSADVVDDYTLRINLPQWNNAIFAGLSTWMYNLGFISPTAYQKNGEEWAKTHLVSTGPFIITEYDGQVGVTYTKNQNYWQAGKPYLDSIKYLVIKDSMAAALAFKKGDGQMLNIPRAMFMDTKAELIKEGYQMVPNDCGMGVYGLFPDSNNSNSPLSNKLVREAVEYAIDKAAFCKTIGYNLWNPIYQVCAPGNAAYNSDLVGRQYDPDKAKQLLAQAGYSPGSLNLNIYPTQGNSILAQAIQSNLKDVGINLNINIIDTATEASYLINGWVNGFMLEGAPGGVYWLNSLNRAFSTPSSNYTSMLKPENFQEVWKEALAAVEYDDIMAKTQEVVRVIQQEAIAIPLFEHDPDFVVNTQVVPEPGLHVGSWWDVANIWMNQ